MAMPRDSYGYPLADPAGHYKNCETDDTSDPIYWGFEALNGAWLIMKQNVVTKAIRYVSGATDFASAWANRASLGYDYPSKIRWY